MSAYERSCGWVREKNQMVVVLITITMMLQLQMKGCLGCLETERMGLLELKSYLNSLLPPGEESNLKSWTYDDGSSDCCLWEKVKCSDDIGGHVVDLSLDLLMPRDFLPRGLNLSLLHSFPALQSFSFSGNYIKDLFDPIHGYKSFQKLEKLRILDLSENRLNYSALTFLNAARSLKTLNLRSNSLEGVFPPNGLISLRELEVLDLSNNFISGFGAGDGNNSFQRLEKLRALNLSYNSLNNSVLPFLSAPSSLRTLSLRFNYLEGVINMNVLQDMPELQELDLSNNDLTDLDSLGVQLHSSLQVLAIAYNGLTSSRKGYSEICRLMYLRELDLSGNALTSMPYCLGNLTRLRTLELSKNELNGDLSSFVSGLPSALEYLSLLQNNFNGSFLFSSLINHTRLAVFKLSSKVGIIQTQAEKLWVPPFQLKKLKLQGCSLGRIPGFLVNQHELCFVDLSNNNLTGAFPTWLVKNNTRLQMLWLNNNSLTELQLPRIVHGLEVLNISSNRIVDSIQGDIGNVFPNLTYMNFASNHFRGAIPSSMGEMKSLQMLDISSNGLSGQLPTRFLSGCYSLKFLKLSNNHLGGEVLPEYANLTSVELILLGGNRFDGSLGKGLLNSKNLRLLDISDNSIFGALPLWIGRMSSLGYLYMRGNQLKGPLPRQLQNLALEVLDISDNNFSGSIPRSLDVSFLRELRLQSNEFEGVIPDNLFNAKQLELLDLRNNNLSGMVLNTIGKNSTLRFLLLRNNSLQSRILKKICQLSGVGLLDLSYNKFRGSIPSCLGSMFSGGERFEGIWFNKTLSFVMDVPFRQTWIYASSLVLVGEFSSGFERQPVRQPEKLINFVMKSRYEAYHGDILGDLYGLDLSCNQLSNEIPVEIGNLHNIKSLNLSRNQLTGSIPDSISKLEDLESLDLSNNKLDGNIPPQLGDLNNLGYFNVSRNNLSGVIPFKGHLGSFDEKSYIGNSHLCGLPTNISCDSTRGPEPSASEHGKEEEEEEEGDGVIDMVWFYWTFGATCISTAFALFVFLCIDSRWSHEWFYRVDLVILYFQRSSGDEEVEVRVENEDDTVLKISGERHMEKEEKKDDTWHRSERSSGHFTRKFRLQENVKMEQVKASMENGALTVETKKLQVKSNKISA